jgi:hypothetical protein
LGSDLAALGGELVVTDALAYDGGGAFALVWDHTFFCAIAPEQRRAWGKMVGRALAPGGAVQALVFPCDKPASEGGPPHGFAPEAMGAALGPGFRLVSDAPVARGVEHRSWVERLARFERVD